VEITESGVPVNALITAIRNSIRRSAADDEHTVHVTAIQLTLHVVTTQTTGGGLNLNVPFLGMPLRLGAKATRQNTQTLNVTLVPSDQYPTHEIRDDSVEETLVDAISTIQEIMTTAAQDDEPWLLDTATVELVFAITSTGTISIGIDHEDANEITHTLHLTLSHA
jgi:hypothetical protein